MAGGCWQRRPPQHIAKPSRQFDNRTDCSNEVVVVVVVAAAAVAEVRSSRRRPVAGAAAG